MTIEEVVRRLIAHEERIWGQGEVEGNKLLLTIKNGQKDVRSKTKSNQDTLKRTTVGTPTTQEVNGKGSTKFQCKNGEHRVLCEVYYIWDCEK